MGFTVGFTVGSVGFKRYLVSVIVTQCGAETKALLQSVLADKRLGHLLPLGGLADAASSRRS